MEVASYRMQAALLAEFLDPETLARLNDLIGRYAAMDPTAGHGGGHRGGGSGSIPGAIDDQTTRLENALARLGALMGDLMTGNLSPLTPEQQFQYLLSEYDRLQGLARSGDVDAMEQLAAIVPQLLGAGSAFFGGTATTAYAALFSQVMGDLASITGLPNPLAGMGYEGATASGAIIGSFQDFAQTQTSGNAQAHDDSTELRAEVASMGQKLDLVLSQLPATGTG